MSDPATEQQQPSRRAVRPVEAVGPDSLYWKYFGDSRLSLLIGAGFLMQIAHPIIGPAIDAQSTYLEDPWGRAQRSLDMLWPVVYNTREGAIEKGKALREWHRPVKGQDKYGTKYNALNPEAYAWVHLTAFDGIINMAKLFDTPLTEAQQDELYQEIIVVGRLLGIRDQDMPANRQAYEAYFDWMINERLTLTEPARLWLQGGVAANMPSPSRLIPGPLWKAISFAGDKLFMVLLKGGLPEEFRTRFNVTYSRNEQRLFNAIVYASRKIWPLVPERLRYTPQAWAAIKDARKHPERYERRSASQSTPITAPPATQAHANQAHTA